MKKKNTDKFYGKMFCPKRVSLHGITKALPDVDWSSDPSNITLSVRNVCYVQIKTNLKS